jgi:hypothetical protein
MMKQFWESKYKPVDTIIPPYSSNPFSTSTPSNSASKAQNEFAAYLHKVKVKAMAKLDAQTQSTSSDEYTRYCAEDVEWVEDPLAWWQEPIQQHKYPNLSKMALNILSIPAMSADVERLFSSAGLTLSDRRNRMGEALLEALECLKSWYKIKEFKLEGERRGLVIFGYGWGATARWRRRGWYILVVHFLYYIVYVVRINSFIFVSITYV